MRDNGSGETWRAAGKRWCKFSLVGAIGIGVQLGALALLTAAGVHYLVATALAVETAVLHNFAWHQNFTWSDREGAVLARLARFHLTNGAISIVGNLALMEVLVGHFGLAPVPANLLSLAACWLANFLAADRLVFLGRRPHETDGARFQSSQRGLWCARPAHPPLKRRATFVVASLRDVFFLAMTVEYDVEYNVE
jgi:putative flippase GtrA